MTTCKTCGRGGLFWHSPGTKSNGDGKVWRLMEVVPGGSVRKHDCVRELLRKEMKVRLRKAGLKPYPVRMVP